MNNLQIVDYDKSYKLYFATLNKAWITRYFELEPMVGISAKLSRLFVTFADSYM